MKFFRYLRDAAVFAPCYIAFDWASYIDPLGPFNITPWNPQAALAIVWMMLGGLAHIPSVLATILLADVIVRHMPGGYAIVVATSLVLTAGYAAVAWTLKSLLKDTGLRSTRQLCARWPPTHGCAPSMPVSSTAMRTPAPCERCNSVSSSIMARHPADAVPRGGR